VAVELRNYVASSLAVHSEYEMSQMQSSLWYFFKLVVLLSSFVLRASLNEMYITEKILDNNNKPTCMYSLCMLRYRKLSSQHTFCELGSWLERGLKQIKIDILKLWSVILLKYALIFCIPLMRNFMFMFLFYWPITRGIFIFWFYR